jgi:hypothetical protein
MEGIALNDRRGDALAAKDVLKSCLHSCRARARRTGNRDDRMFCGHGVTSDAFSRSGTASACGKAAFLAVVALVFGSIALVYVALMQLRQRYLPAFLFSTR